LLRKAQWQFREGLTADSCGGSSGFGPHRNGGSHRIPSSPINAISAPELPELKRVRCMCQAVVSISSKGAAIRPRLAVNVANCPHFGAFSMAVIAAHAVGDDFPCASTTHTLSLPRFFEELKD